MADSVSVYVCAFAVFAAVLVRSNPTTNPEINITANVTTASGTSSVVVANSGDAGSSNSCAEVRQVFVLKHIGPSEAVEDSAVTGNELEVCAPTGTCCTKSMESGYREVVKKDFRSMLQSSSSFLKTLLASSATKFRDNFLEMVHVSQNNTNVLFSEVYKKMDTLAQVHVSNLYTSLSDYILGKDVDLDRLLSLFFDALFPVVYHHSINPKLKDFNDDYKECLRQAQREIRPFGDIPKRISDQMTRSFRAARTLLQALHLGVEVINVTDHMDFRQECSRGLLRLAYCAYCQGHVTAKPCSGYCLNVARGCLAGVAELDQPWSDFVSSLERLTSGMVSTYNIEEVLSMLDTKISEAIMYAMENGPEVSKRAKGFCGHPRRATRDVTEPHPPLGPPDRIVSVRTAENSLYVRLQQLVQRLAETKGQYSNLADVLCSDDSWAIREEGQCWNGDGLGEYTKTIAGVGIAAQRYNPEMKAPQDEDLIVTALVDKLQHMSKLLNSRVTPVPQSDSYMIEGSGSGGWMRNRIGDDEDYNRGSGSGDWEGTKPSDFNFDDNRNPGNVNDNNNGGAFVVSANNHEMALAVLLGILLSTRFLLPSP